MSSLPFASFCPRLGCSRRIVPPPQLACFSACFSDHNFWVLVIMFDWLPFWPCFWKLNVPGNDLFSLYRSALVLVLESRTRTVGTSAIATYCNCRGQRLPWWWPLAKSDAYERIAWSYITMLIYAICWKVIGKSLMKIDEYVMKNMLNLCWNMWYRGLRFAVVSGGSCCRSFFFDRCCMVLHALWISGSAFFEDLKRSQTYMQWHWQYRVMIEDIGGVWVRTHTSRHQITRQVYIK